MRLLYAAAVQERVQQHSTGVQQAVQNAQQLVEVLQATVSELVKTQQLLKQSMHVDTHYTAAASSRTQSRLPLQLHLNLQELPACRLQQCTARQQRQTHLLQQCCWLSALCLLSVFPASKLHICSHRRCSSCCLRPRC